MNDSLMTTFALVLNESTLRLMQRHIEYDTREEQQNNDRIVKLDELNEMNGITYVREGETTLCAKDIFLGEL